MTLNLVSAWTHGRDTLRGAGLPTPALDARLLLEAAAGVERIHILTDPYRALPEDAIERLNAFLARRVAREPVAYIVGRVGFWTIDLAVGPAVLTPRPETETLVAAALEESEANDALRVLDLGVGSGAILLAVLSERPAAKGTGVDISEPALAVAAANAEALGLSDRAVFQVGDWGAGLEGPFDLIVSNPPYIASAEIEGLEPDVRDYEPRLALDGGADGLDAYRAVARWAGRLLAPGGRLVLELGLGQAPAVSALLAAEGLVVEQVRPDLMGVDRALLARKPLAE